MKIEQEQTKQMLKTLCDKFQCSAIDRSYMAKSCRQCEDIIEALHEAGYGNISRYKAEIEQLEQQNAIQCDAWQKLSDENESLATENSSYFRYNSALRKENKKLKEEIKQAQLNILGKLWSNISNSKQLIQSHIADGSFTIEDIYMEIDELMAEVEDAEDKG